MESLVTQILQVLSLVVATSMAYEIAKPGCPSECGGVQIPFPFGIGHGCYLNTDLSNVSPFKINCDTATSRPIPFLVKNTSKWEVLSISLEDHNVRISSGAVYHCHVNTGESTVPSASPNSTYSLLESVFGEFFALSNVRNKLVAIGCDTTASLGYQRKTLPQCKTSCLDITDPHFGFCEASIPDYLSGDSIHLVHNLSSVYTTIYPCNYAFVVEVGSYNFSATNLTTTSVGCYNMRVPVVYNWYLGSNLTCSANAEFLVDAYHCQCSNGYTGNPYLLHGCQDINECLEAKLNECERLEFCVNTKGGYDCRCPEGHHGNGTITSPCIAALGDGQLIAGNSTKLPYKIAKPGCLDECGGVQIPFPFGIGDGCYFPNNTDQPNNSAFRINCDYYTDPPIPFIMTNTSKWEVLSINLEEYSIRVSSGAAYHCYDTGESVPSANSSRSSYSLLDSEYGYSFALSTDRNKFVAIGCNAKPWLMDYSDINHTMSPCHTSCSDVSMVKDVGTTCNPVFGCCEASIHNMSIVRSIRLDNLPSSIDSQVDVYTYPCSYAFVVEVDSYNFSAMDLTVTATGCYDMRVPVVYHWSMRYNSDDFTYDLSCSTNSDVFIYDRCQCSKGYTGNPYLPDGCQDINECLEEELNACERLEFCVNTDGGYVCQCPNRHHGNGTLTSPCIPAPGYGQLMVGVCIGTSLVIVSILALYGMYKLIKRGTDAKEREDNFERNGGLLLQQKISANEVAIDGAKVFSRRDLEKATDNFNDNRVLGRGGQGVVYKGMLEDGTIVAVKMSKKVDENQLAQFINEVVILSQISHRNVVKLFGCCLETEVPMLVYEFVPNGTLYQHIHHPSEVFYMTWKVRFQIAMECAGAIAYLHSSCSSPIYHRDIKSSNILLDEKYKAKVSDFGTSRTICIDKTHVTTCVQGTFGYLDPEFFRSSQFSEKSDVYSFGVVLLELLTSKKPIFTNTSREPLGLATEFLQLMETSPYQLHGFLDAQVLQQCSEEEIEALTKLIEQCLSSYGKQRPTMREVARTLEMIYSQHEGNAANDQEEGCVIWTDHMSVTNEGPYSTSAFTDTSCSMNLEFLFDSKSEA